MRVRMVEADHREPRRPRPAADCDVVFGIEEIPVRIVRQIARFDRLKDLVLPADEHAAAFAGVRPLGVAEDRLEGRATQFTIHNFKLKMSEASSPRSLCKFQIFNCKFSTAIAIPIPPPMHSAATPYRSLRARRA